MQSFISREQDYALRITTRLAELEDGKHISVTDLSEELSISRNFAARIVHTLKNMSIVNTIQGKFGGVMLAKEASDISLFEVLSKIGFKMRFNDCICDPESCDRVKECKYHRFFREQEKIFFDTLKNKTINEFISQ